MQLQQNSEQAPSNTEIKPVFISVDEMANMLSIARATAYQLTKTSDFPCFYIGKRIIIPLNSFQEWATKQAKNRTSLSMEG
jgi:predicted DNA-binding transcriptional regulator AlpA